MGVSEFRFEYPRLFRLSLGLLLLGAVLAGFLAVPVNDLTRTIGLTRAQEMTRALHYALRWQFRAWIHPTGAPAPPRRLFGNVLGIEADLRLIASVAAETTYQHRYFEVADAKIVDLLGTARFLAQHRLDEATFEVYAGNQAVIWLNGQPLNVLLVELGLAIPDPNPPTNIVDQTFAAYYWSIVKGK